MHSFIIISKNVQKREDEAMRLCDKECIDVFDRTIVDREEGDEKKQKLSLGIEDVKNMQKKLFLKPFRGDKKAVILKDAHLLTTEAQNALLKVLEEPPDNTILILTSESKDALLPTVRSRCRVVDLGREELIINDDERRSLEAILFSIPELNGGEALKLAEKVGKNKDEALQWLEKMMIITRSSVISQISPTSRISGNKQHSLQFLKSLQTTYTTIKTTNVNLRLALEYLFLP
jgi:hypothetical protein